MRLLHKASLTFSWRASLEHDNMRHVDALMPNQKCINWNLNMKKTAIAIIVSIFSSQSIADCQYSKKIILPTWFTANTAEYVYNIVNTSSAPIQIKITLINGDGNEYTEDTNPGQNFFVASHFIGNPISIDGATLNSRNHGALIFRGTTPGVSGYGELTWTSERCLDAPLLISMTYGSPNHFDWFHLNGGKPL